MGVKEGDVAVISGRPGGTYFPEVDADWYLIGGDEAALPAMGTLLEALPSSIRGYVLAEVPDADWELELGGGGRAADTVAGPPGGRVLAELPHFNCHAVHNGRILRFPIPPLHDLASAFLRFLHAGCAGPGGLGTANNFLDEPQVDFGGPRDVGVQLGDSLR